jgi:N-acetylmuramoyl-L-alanine amidase
MAVVARGGTATHRSDLRSAIQASDNAAAERLWSSLGTAGAASSLATAELRKAGDRRTVVQSRHLREQFTAFGQTGWRLSDQARFTAGMPCLSEGRAVLDLMGGVVAAHRWGLGAVQARAQLKGGWGPGSRPGDDGGYIDRQMGILTTRGKRYAVAIATAPADATHETGTAHLTRIAKWVVEHVDVRSIGASARCGGAQGAQIVASAAATPLRGTTIVLDPGHNGGNARAPSAINRVVNIGQGKTKACNTTRALRPKAAIPRRRTTGMSPFARGESCAGAAPRSS